LRFQLFQKAHFSPVWTIAGNLRYTTPLSVEDVASFYRNAYPARNYSEDAA
jgi:hypothetical protein